MTEETDPGEKIASLEGEVDQLRRAMASHAVVDQAIGVLMAVSGLRSEEGWDVLHQVSQHTNVKLREVALHVLRWVNGSRLPEEIRPRLHTAVIDTRRARYGNEAAPRRQERTGQCRRAGSRRTTVGTAPCACATAAPYSRCIGE